MEVKKRGKAKIVICIVLLILLAAVNYFTARPSNLLPEFFPYASYPVLTDNMEQTIPSHSAVWVEKDASVKENSIIVYEMDGAVHLARLDGIEPAKASSAFVLRDELAWSAFQTPRLS